MNLKLSTLLFFLFVSFTIFGQDLNLQMEAHFDFENNITDQSGNDNNLEVLQGAANFINYNGGQALSLDGNTQITTSNPFDVSHSDSFAISIIFRTSTITSDLQTLLQGANIGFGVFIEATTGKLYTFLDRSSADPILSIDPVTDGEWHHAIVESNGSTTSLYLDGVFQGSRVEVLDVGNGANDNRIFLGATNLNTRQFTGEIDNVRFYSRDLTPCDRIELVLNNFEPEGIFPFEGNLEDESERQADFEVINGQISYEIFAAGDEAIVFDGNTQIATMNSYDNSDFKNVAISFWFRAEEAKDHRQVLIQGAEMGTVIFLEEDSGNLRISFDGSSGGSITSINSVTDGQWHHVTAMSIGTETVMVIDGILDGSTTENLVVGNGGSNNKWYLGQTNLSQWPFTGAINNLTIYDHLITQCQIDRIVEMGPVSNTENLIETKADFKVYPNPSADVFFIDFKENSIPDLIEVLDLNGKLVYSDNQIKEAQYSLLLNQSSGVFILRTISENSFSTVKLIKH